LALGYEDLSDHDQLREDPLLAVLSGKRRVGEEARAGKSTLNRWELSTETPSRYKKIHCRQEALDELLLGFARNDRLRRRIDPQMQEAARLQKESGKPARVFTEFFYQTTTGSWSRARRDCGSPCPTTALASTPSITRKSSMHLRGYMATAFLELASA